MASWNTPISDPTAFLLLFININTFFFVFKKDFSPLYKQTVEAPIDKQKKEGQDILNELAEEFMLTEREREVALLVLEGYTNPDIAGKLFISKNTVRNHTHNIFEKLGVASRIELIQRIHLER